jgi:putative hemolysin
MKALLFEVIVIFVLLLANGLFAMTEIAVVSARKGRLRRFAERGDPRAKLALDLADSPNRFLPTVQVGITMVGIFAGAYGGATIAEKIAQAVSTVPMLAPYGQAIGLVSVVAVITYLSLVVGELVPKRIGLSHPESIAMAMARPMNALAVVASPVVKLLGASTERLLRLLGLKLPAEPVVNEEEVQGLMQEGLRAGAFNQVESQIVNRALELDRLTARDLMTPRPHILWLSQNDTHETVWHKVVVSGHSNFPVYAGDRDHVVGIVSLKAIYANLAAGVPVRIADLMTAPLVVPDSQTAVQLLDTFKQSRKHVALVTDEFGSIVGLVTLHDVMEAIMGEFPSPEERAQPQLRRREDGSWLIDAASDIERVEKALPGVVFSQAEQERFQTLAGFVARHLGHVPREGETLEWRGYLFEVLDMDHHRVDKVLVSPAPKSGSHPAMPLNGDKPR